MSSNDSFVFESTDRGLDSARAHARNGRLVEAESLYRHVLTQHPDQVEALRFIANAELSRGNAGEAVALLSRAVQADRSDTGALLELGMAYRNAQRMDEARSVLQLALEQGHGRNITARLMLANVLELDARPDVALLNYLRAIIDAQSSGQWIDAATTEPGLQNMVLHAMQYVVTHRRKLFDEALVPITKGIDVTRLSRIDAALANYLGEQPMPQASTDRRPTFLFLPDLGSERFLDNGLFDWLGTWSSQLTPLDAEAIACLDGANLGDEPAPLFSLKSMADRGHPAAAPRWAVLCQHGAFQDAVRQHAPRILELLDAAPLVRVPDYAPDVAVLELPPATRTPARYGRSNAFCTVVVAFSESASLRVTVDGKTRLLQSEGSLVLDPSFEFSLTATGAAPARAIILDVWNPKVTSIERDALAALATTAVAFDQRLQDLT